MFFIGEIALSGVVAAPSVLCLSSNWCRGAVAAPLVLRLS